MTDQSSCRIAPKSRHTTDRALYQQGCCRFVTKRFLATGPAADPGQPRDQDGAPGKFLPLPSITARLKFTLVCRKTQPPVDPPSRGLFFCTIPQHSECCRDAYRHAPKITPRFSTCPPAI